MHVISLLLEQAQVMWSLSCWYRLKLHGLPFASTGPTYVIWPLSAQAQRK